MNRPDLVSCVNDVDASGAPAGGYCDGLGIAIRWQRGPLGRGANRTAPNGAFVETVLHAVHARISHYQSTKFRCTENAEALMHIEAALSALNKRTNRREIQGVEGTHETHEAVAHA